MPRFSEFHSVVINVLRMYSTDLEVLLRTLLVGLAADGLGDARHGRVGVGDEALVARAEGLKKWRMVVW